MRSFDVSGAVIQIMSSMNIRKRFALLSTLAISGI